MNKRYTYRLRPGAKAEKTLLAEWDRCRFVWNMCVARYAELREEGITATGFTLGRELTDWRGRYEWLALGVADVQQRTIRAWWFAQQAAFKGAGTPKFKVKDKSRPSLGYPKSGYKLQGCRLYLAKGVSSPIVLSRALPDKHGGLRVYQDAVGHWWASFVVECDAETVPESDQAIGIDWGVQTIAATTDPEYDLPNTKPARCAQAALTKVQRRMARRQPAPGHQSSNGYKTAKREAAKLHRKVRWQRDDAAKKWASVIVRDHGLIAVEDFKPKFMVKNRRLARSAGDAAVGAAKRHLISKASETGRQVVLVPPSYTTMTCSKCGTRAKERIELSVRIFTCPRGYAEDRDRNAARVILARAGFNPTCVEDVRRKTVDGCAQSEHGSFLVGSGIDNGGDN